VKRLENLLAELGPWGIAAVGVLLFCLAFDVGALRPTEQELAALRQAAARRSALEAARERPASPSEERYQRFYALFPPLEQLPEELERLYGLARATGVDLPRADYRLEDRGAPLAAYHVTLPLRGPYPRIRAFLGATLQAMPTAAVDALLLERKKPDAAEIEAQLRMTLYFRTAAGEPVR